jgi:hypothetical protein
MRRAAEQAQARAATEKNRAEAAAKWLRRVADAQRTRIDALKPTAVGPKAGRHAR